MLKTMWMAFVLLLTSWQIADAQEKRLDTLIPQSIQPLLRQAQNIINTTFVGYKDRGTIVQPNAEFADALKQIGERLDASTAQQIAALEGTDIRATLVAIAWDAHKRPQVYREIEQDYAWHIVNPYGRALTSQQVQDKHATEAYRLPWEYLLLSPPFLSEVGGYEQRAQQALTRIRNEASIAAIVYAFGRTVVEGTPLANWHDGVEYIHTLICFDNTAGLRGILECLSLADDKRRRHPPEDPTEFPAFEYARKYLSVNIKPERAALWRGLIAGYPRRGLTGTPKFLLDSIALPPRPAD